MVDITKFFTYPAKIEALLQEQENVVMPILDYIRDMVGEALVEAGIGDYSTNSDRGELTSSLQIEGDVEILVYATNDSHFENSQYLDLIILYCPDYPEHKRFIYSPTDIKQVNEFVRDIISELSNFNMPPI